MVRNKMLSVAKGPVFTTAVIMTVASFVLTVISWFVLRLSGSLGTVFSVLSRSNPEMASELYYLLGEASIVSRIVSTLLNLILSIPTILMVIGLLVFISSVRKPNPVAKGLGAIKAGLIINVVVLGICALILLIGGVAAVIMGMTVDEEVAIIGAVVLLVSIIAFVFIFWYYGAMLSTAGVAGRVINNGVMTKKPSMYVAVINIISFVLNIISFVFTTLPMLRYMGMMNIFLGALPSLLGTISILLFAIAIIQARSMPVGVTNSVAAGYNPDLMGNNARHCTNCGRPLYGNEVCYCQSQNATPAGIPVTPAVNDSVPDNAPNPTNDSALSEEEECEQLLNDVGDF